MYHIAEYAFVLRNLLFADGGALKTTDGTTTSLKARFSSIHSFAQISRSEVIFTDFNNHCLRSLDRKTNQTSTYCCNCTNIGHRDGVDALLAHPVSVILDLMNSQQLIISEYYSGSLRTVNTVSKHVSTIYLEISYRLAYLLQDSAKGDIYATFNRGVGFYDYQSNKFCVITGSATFGFLDGELSRLNFNAPRGLAFLSHSTLLVADVNNYRLRVLDLTTNTSSSICSGIKLGLY